jgi:isopenicillin N synthase-like dioxygenase
MKSGASVRGVETARVPVIDVTSLVHASGDQRRTAEQIGEACRDSGFFYVVGHGVDVELQRRLDRLARRFFARDVEEKMRLRMELGGRAWRGYFPVGGELTSGKPDAKEGLYFGAELAEDDPRVRAGTPLHGRNLFPADLPEFRETVLSYMDALTGLGHALMRGVALSLGLEGSYFHDRYTSDPLILFRIFRYPPVPADSAEPQWGVGEHTDYGMLTILMQDEVGGLQVKTPRGWTLAPPVPDSFICNIGDMLDRMTRGLYRSTPHRVRNVSGRERFSFPFFFDPGWDARVKPIELPGPVPVDDREQRWDKASVHAFEGTYGDYILAKVAKVFPNLSGAR